MTRQDDKLIASFLRNESDIKRYFKKATGSEADADDLAQEAWIKLARNGATALSAPLPYLIRIARTLTLDHTRNNKRRLKTGDVAALLDVADTAPDAYRQVEGMDQLRWLQCILGELPERQRLILTAARIEERRHSDIAEEFGVSIRTVELELRKALDYCSERLKQINRV